MDEALTLSAKGKHLDAALLLVDAAGYEKTASKQTRSALSDNGNAPAPLERLALTQFTLAGKGALYRGLLLLKYPKWDSNSAVSDGQK